MVIYLEFYYKITLFFFFTVRGYDLFCHLFLNQYFCDMPPMTDSQQQCNNTNIRAHNTCISPFTTL